MLLELDKTASGELSENDLHHCISSRYSIYLLYWYKSANTDVFLIFLETTSTTAYRACPPAPSNLVAEGLMP